MYPSKLDPEMILITKEEYCELLENSLWVSCLEEAGVDNWEGIEIAQDLLRDYQKEEKNESTGT